MSESAPVPKVSVVTTTYNQEAYVRQALDGVVAQITDFPVELIVADDASTDATARIVAEYAERHPGLILPILREQNVGLFANLVGALGTTRGTYLALCEGDDYWTDPLKLSKQVAHLDAHPHDTVCFHPVRVTWEDGRAEDTEFPWPAWRDDLSTDALLETNFIQTNSVMYRRLERYDDIPEDVMPLDWYLHVRHAAHGRIAMLPETMSVYRRHPEGMWGGSVDGTAAFWTRFGPGHAALADAMLDLFPDDPARRARISGLASLTLTQLAALPGPEGEALLLDTVARHPQVAVLALDRERTRIAGLKTELTGFRERVTQAHGRLDHAATRIEARDTRIEQQKTRIQEQVTQLRMQDEQIAEIPHLRTKLEKRDAELRVLRRRRPRARAGRLLRQLGLRRGRSSVSPVRP